MRFRLSSRRVTGLVLALAAAWIAVDPAVVTAAVPPPKLEYKITKLPTA